MNINLKDKAFNFDNRFIVAIDGPSASGKGTISRLLAERLNLDFFQSSLTYRGLAMLCIEKHIDLTDNSLISDISCSPKIIEYAINLDLNDEKIGEIASRIAVIPEVRKNLTNQLIEIIKNSHRIVMEGRDIGTIVAKDADLKIFIKANIQARAERRYKQLLLEGKNCILPEILEHLKIRDARDSTRKIAPLIPASGALIIDTSNLTPIEVVKEILDFCNL